MKREDFVFSVAQLREYLRLKNIPIAPGLLSEEHPFRLLIPTYYVDLINWQDPNDALMKMVLTSNLEQDVRPYEVEDPIGDKPHSPVPGVIHRHKNRCLLMLTNVCAVHCRFCFRKNMLNDNRADMPAAMDYIKATDSIEEVILSGGDPFTFPDVFMKSVVTKLGAVEHVRMIRFHTRTPVVYPARVTESFQAALVGHTPTTVVLHINHVREITPEFVSSVYTMKKAGIMLLSQTVLMKGVNDSVEDLSALMRGLVECGVKPYYLHHLDAAAGTHHFRISLSAGRALYAGLRASISGIAVPLYVIDLPGGYGKYPVDMFVQMKKGEYEVTLHDGRRHTYIDYAEDAGLM